MKTLALRLVTLGALTVATVQGLAEFASLQSWRVRDRLRHR